MEITAVDTKTGKPEKRKPGRFSLGLKMNLIIVVCILLSSLGVLGSAYYFHGKQIKEIFFSDAASAALNVSNIIDPDCVEWFWNQVNTDEYRSIHKQAVEANDPGIIEDWMSSKSSYFVENDYLDLMGDYQYMYEE